MSKKYVPSFIKEQAPTPSVPTSSEPSWITQRTTVNAINKFEALSDDFTMVKNRPVVNTSLPAKEAPKLAPATLASITSNGIISTASSSLSQQGGSKRSFASKFSEQVKIASNPNYKPPPKVVDVNSATDFPTLGAPKNIVTKSVSTIPDESVKVDKPSGLSFAEKAKEWAKHTQEEAEEATRKAIEEENKRRTAALSRGIGCIGMKRFKNNTNYYDDDEDYNYEESSLGDDDSFEVPDHDEEPSSSEDDENENEINQNVGWDGRRKGDLY